MTNLASLLKPFEVRPGQKRLPGRDHAVRGYFRSHLEKAFREYGLEPELSRTPLKRAA